MLEQLLPEAWLGSYVVKLLLAALFGGVIGLEREMHGRDAGLRTNMLVCVGAALFTVVSLGVAASTGVADPGRIAAQIVTGIGFLGAGAIIKEGFTVRGLTTAASLWIVAGIGMAVGAGQFDAGLLGTAVAIGALFFLGRLHRGIPRDSYRRLEVVTGLTSQTDELISVLKDAGAQVQATDIMRDHRNGEMRITYHLRLFHSGRTDKLAHNILRRVEEGATELRSVYWFRS
jgi:putative Mg2+ transporter-C (MgtC) family protein